VDEPDPQVVAAARAGEMPAFEKLVRRYQADVWRLSFHLIRDEDLASDITQEAFVRAYRNLKRYRGEARFTTWLFSIARNCAIDEMRRNQRRTRIRDRFRAERPKPESDVSLSIEIREAVAALDHELREPLVLIDMFGMSYSEVSGISGVPVGTIKSRMHRARSILARELRPESSEAQDGV
jgi:RNA polymerase sigma-70 factor (ECF subfamily)